MKFLRVDDREKCYGAHRIRFETKQIFNTYLLIMIIAFGLYTYNIDSSSYFVWASVWQDYRGYTLRDKMQEQMCLKWVFELGCFCGSSYIAFQGSGVYQYFQCMDSQNKYCLAFNFFFSKHEFNAIHILECSSSYPNLGMEWQTRTWMPLFVCIAYDYKIRHIISYMHHFIVAENYRL